MNLVSFTAKMLLWKSENIPDIHGQERGWILTYERSTVTKLVHWLYEQRCDTTVSSSLYLVKPDFLREQQARGLE